MLTERRLQQLADNIRQDLNLLKAYEDELRYETDPRRMAEYRREIERQRESLTRNQKEYAELRRQMTSEELQNVTDLMQQKDAKLDEILKLLPPIFRKFLGEDHQSTATVRNNLELLANV